MKETPINHWKNYMKKTWIIGAAVSALLGSQASFAASEPAGQKVDAGMLTTTSVKENTATPRNPFSGDNTVTSVTPAPVPDIKIDLLEEQLLSQQLTKWAQSNGYKLLWNSSSDFVIYKAIHLQGKSIQDVLIKLGQVFTSENYGLVIKDYQANHVLIIDEQ
ncbi:TcpQ domain-containing protein [Citrobacter braakii]|uniref:TcpQ domain-containing protein n=1 Tax=Citrobacter braakii TaxID=57706 RepID=UPI00226D9FDC|nr:TcpQ domain-containing protein [Citrobacter braakii]WAD29070.1 TcpQ domain-containing protein [Citrobacter braakii]